MARVIEFYIPTNFRREVASVYAAVATRKSDRVLPTGKEISVARPSATAHALRLGLCCREFRRRVIGGLGHKPFEQRPQLRAQVQFLAFLLKHPTRITRRLQRIAEI